MINSWNIIPSFPIIRKRSSSIRCWISIESCWTLCSATSRICLNAIIIYALNTTLYWFNWPTSASSSTRCIATCACSISCSYLLIAVRSCIWARLKCSFTVCATVRAASSISACIIRRLTSTVGLSWVGVRRSLTTRNTLSFIVCV